MMLENDDNDLTIEEESTFRNLAYAYQPLPDAHHFRLLYLLPGEETSRLECQILTRSFDTYNYDPPLYCAISYT